MSDAAQIARLAAVVLLLVAAALVATPRGRLPLALRGLWRVMRRDGLAVRDARAAQPVGARRRLLAFLLVVLAAGVAVI